MKKTFLVIVLIAAASLTSFAQISIGPKMGLNVSKVPTNEKNLPPNNKELIKTGLNVGVAINAPLIEKISLQTELLFSQKGYKDQWKRTKTVVEESITLGYLELSALPRFTFGKESIKGYVNAGPSVAYLISGKKGFIENENIEEEKLDFGNLEHQNLLGIKRLDIGLNIGGGILLTAGSGNIVLDLRYGYGITPLRKWTDQNGNKNQWNNSAISLTFGYLFGL